MVLQLRDVSRAGELLGQCAGRATVVKIAEHLLPAAFRRAAMLRRAAAIISA